jgi:hypothetical protein
LDEGRRDFELKLVAQNNRSSCADRELQDSLGSGSKLKVEALCGELDVYGLNPQFVGGGLPGSEFEQWRAPR